MAAVVREGSFERAAQPLFDTPSAVSQRIRSLEERLGCAVVVRGQPGRPTDTGRHLFQHLDRVRLFEQEPQGVLPALAPDGLTRVALPIAFNADSLATWFVTASLAGMGWELQPEVLVAPHLAMGSLVELVPDTALDVPLYWQHARAASSPFDGLSQVVMAAAARALRPL